MSIHPSANPRADPRADPRSDPRADPRANLRAYPPYYNNSYSFYHARFVPTLILNNKIYDGSREWSNTLLTDI